jgi:hypothetical protein
MHPHQDRLTHTLLESYGKSTHFISLYQQNCPISLKYILLVRRLVDFSKTISLLVSE